MSSTVEALYCGCIASSSWAQHDQLWSRTLLRYGCNSCHVISYFPRFTDGVAPNQEILTLIPRLGDFCYRLVSHIISSPSTNTLRSSLTSPRDAQARKTAVWNFRITLACWIAIYERPPMMNQTKSHYHHSWIDFMSGTITITNSVQVSLENSRFEY